MLQPVHKNQQNNPPPPKKKYKKNKHWASRPKGEISQLFGFAKINETW